MILMRTILNELIGLFIDDGSLAVALLIWCATIGVVVRLAPWLSAAGCGVALLLGSVAILLINVSQAARSRGRGR